MLLTSSTSGEDAVATPCHAHSLRTSPLAWLSPLVLRLLPARSASLLHPGPASESPGNDESPLCARTPVVQQTSWFHRSLLFLCSPDTALSPCCPSQSELIQSVLQCLGSNSSYRSPHLRWACAELQLRGSQKAAHPPCIRCDASTARSPWVPTSTRFCKAEGTGLSSDLTLSNHQHT